jgi:exodeoxyribonuclease V gamma subunit
VLVSELCDYIDRGYSINGRPASTSITFNHRLQPFSREYFQRGGKLFTYSSDRYAAAKARYGEMRPAQPFFVDALPEPERGEGVSIDELVWFFQNPCRALLERRLGIVERRESEGLEDSEPFGIDNLARFQIENEMLRRYLEHGGDDTAFERFRARGELPHGGAGVIALRSMTDEVRNMAIRVSEFRGGSPAKTCPVDITIRQHRLSGEIGNLWPGGALNVRMGKLRALDRISAWITHCVLNACGIPVRTMCLTRDFTLTMEPYDGAEGALAGLLGWYDLGMTRPLPFFPNTSLACAEAIQSGHDSDAAIGRAYGKWFGEYGGFRGESADYYIKLCFGHTDPLNGEFVEVARSILGPMLECQTVEGA